MLTREQYLWTRKIIEVIEIPTQRPTLNQDTGNDLPATFDNLLSHDHPSKNGHVTGETIVMMTQAMIALTPDSDKVFIYL